MKRPKHDLTWRSIRRQWANPKDQQNNINQPIQNYRRKSPSEPFLSNVLESLSNTERNIHEQLFPSPDAQKEERSDLVLEVSVPSISEIEHSRHSHDLTGVLHSLDTETIRSELRIIISQLAFINNQIRQQDKHDDESQDWEFVAMVIDRLCLIIFITSMTLFTLLTFLSTPHFFKLQ